MRMACLPRAVKLIVNPTTYYKAMTDGQRFPISVLRAPGELDYIVPVGREFGNAHALLIRNESFVKLGGKAPWDKANVWSEQTHNRITEPEHLDAEGPPELRHACWDAYTCNVFAVMGNAVVRVSEEGKATVIAGHPEEEGQRDGVGLSARLGGSRCVMSDGEGCLYLINGEFLHRLQLPTSWRRVPAATAGTCAAAPSSIGRDQGAQQQEETRLGDSAGAKGGACAPGLPAGQVQVTTTKFGAACGSLQRGRYNPASRSLVLTSDTAVYRLPVEGLKGAAAGAVHQPVLLAGSEERTGDSRDGMGAEARFSNIYSLAVDGSGCSWVLEGWWTREDDPDEEDFDCFWGGTRLRRVDPSGAVTTIPLHPLQWEDQCYASIAVLQNGCLAMASFSMRCVVLLHLGLTPPWPVADKIPSAPAPGTLSSDLGELLDRQPDGSADVEVEVGGQVFAAHRGVLAARSPYFRQRLDPGAGFADGRAPRLSLPDADPAAFGAVLRFMYTDSAGPVPLELLQPVGELADRLLLPGLCTQVGSQLLGRVCAESVVGLLLWAEQRSGSFGALLGGLNEWVLDNTGPESGRLLPEEEAARLMRDSPSLALQLLYYRRADGREHKRRRQE